MPAAFAEPSPGRGATFMAPGPPSHPAGERAVSVLWSFCKCLGALLPVYLAGYYGCSISVVLFGLMLYMGWKHGRQGKMMRLKSAMYLLENEREFTTESVLRAKRDLPPWVRNPDAGRRSAALQPGSFDTSVRTKLQYHTWMLFTSVSLDSGQVIVRIACKGDIIRLKKKILLLALEFTLLFSFFHGILIVSTDPYLDPAYVQCQEELVCTTSTLRNVT